MDSHRLQQRPEAEAKSIEKLCARVRSGEIRIPHFQRPMRWRSRDIIALFDSIWRGFPIGELLLSKQPAGAERLTFGMVVVDAPARSDALMVIDGQQRVTSLAGVLMHPDPIPRGDIHAIWFDLETECFHRLTKSNPPMEWISLREVVDSANLVRWLREWKLGNDRPDLVERAILLGKAIREYEVPAYIVHQAEERVLRLIFNRVNNYGIALAEGEVFDALHGSGERKPLEEARARIREEGFGEIDSKWFLRALKAVGGIEPKVRAEKIDVAGHPNIVSETEIAIKRVLSFLVIDAGIPHRDLLPYNLPLVILARFYRLHPMPSQRNRTLLVHWLWRGALTGSHAASSDVEVRRLTRLIDENESHSVQRLLSTVPREWQSPSSLEPWQSASAKTRLFALALISLNPLDPKTHEPLNTGGLQFQVGQDPPGFVDMTNPRRRSGKIASFVFLTGERRVQQHKLQILKTASEDVLHSHCLDHETLQALEESDTEKFIVLRAQRLDSRAQRFFEMRAGAHESDRPAISEILRGIRGIEPGKDAIDGNLVGVTQ